MSETLRAHLPIGLEGRLFLPFIVRISAQIRMIKVLSESSPDLSEYLGNFFLNLFYKMAEYDSTINYVSLHLEWIQANKNFKPKGGLDSVVNGKPHYETYYDQQAAIYRDLKDPNHFAWICLRDDVRWKSGARKDVNDQVNLMFGITKKENFPEFFVTFNFANDLFDSQKVLKDVALFLKLSWIQSCYGVFEYHTETGGHPHLMMIIAVNKNSNKVKDKMLESRLAKYCRGANFIDVKRAKEFHHDYVQLQKALPKSEFLEKDVLWRIEQNLPHEIVK